MNYGIWAGSALKCVDRWLSSLPFLSEDILFQALPAKTGDYPEFPADILTELFLRRWLYPPTVEEADRWLYRIAPHLHRSRFAALFAKWVVQQSDRRAYEIPRNILYEAKSEIEVVLVHALQDGFYKWREAHGVIAFLVPKMPPNEEAWEETPPIEDTLLPFRLIDRNLHEPVADFGKRAAVLAQGMRRDGPSPDDIFLHFPTMPKKLPPWMEGESGALAIWYALRANNNALPRKTLDVGLAGCLGAYSTLPTLDYRANPDHLVLRKWELFRRARVPIVVLPDTMGAGGPSSHECTLWPHSQPIGSHVDDLLDRQSALHPDAKVIKHIEACLIEGEEELELVGTLRILTEMERRNACREELACRINFLAYICSCRLKREPEAAVREQRILDLSTAEIRDLPLQLRSATYGIENSIASRLAALAEILMKKFRNYRHTLP
jgi:hypothetical protein